MIIMAISLPGTGFVASRRPQFVRTGNFRWSLSSRGFSPPRRGRKHYFGSRVQTSSYNDFSLYCLGDLYWSANNSGRSIIQRKLLSLGRDVILRGDVWRDLQGHYGKMTVVHAKKIRISSDLRDEGGELKVEAADLLELEFGRLLGEDRQTTMAKVIGKKINPDLSYMKLGKQQEKQVQLFTRSKQDLRQVKVISPPLPPRGDAERIKQVFPGDEVVPNLAGPPIRPKSAVEQNHSPSTAIRVVPLVRLGGRKRSQAADLNAYEGLTQKPIRGRPHESGLPPVLPVREVIPPMLMRTKAESAPGNKWSSTFDGLLRRPAIVSPITAVISSPQNQEADISSLSTEDLQLRDNLGSLDMSGKLSARVLEGEQSLQLGIQVPAPETEATFASITSTLMKPNRPNLETKLIVLARPLSPVTQDASFQDTANGIESGVDEIDKIAESTDSVSLNSIVKSVPKSSESSSKWKKNAQTSIILFPSEDTQDVMKKQPTTAMLKQSQEEERKENSSRSTIDESGIIEVKTRHTDVKRPVLILKNTSPIPKPVKVAPLADKNSLISAMTLFDPVIGPLQTYQNQDSEKTSELNNSESVRPSGQLLELGSVKDSGTVSVQESAKDADRGVYRSKDLLGPQHRKTEADIVKATQSQDFNSQLLEKKKSMMTSSGSVRRPLLMKPPSPVGIADLMAAQPNSALESKLQKAVKIHDERKTAVNKDEEDEDWARAEALRDSKAVEEVMIIGNARGGLMASFGSLVGYLPAFELTAKKRPPSFAAWAQRRGIDLRRKFSSEIQGDRFDLMMKQMVTSTTTDQNQESGILGESVGQKISTNIASVQELLELYKEERETYLSLLCVEKVKVKVIVTSVDRTLRQLCFSQKQAEGEDQEQARKKIQLMENLNVGDIVTCEVKKITAIGAFVELQGVPALIHVSELSWNRNIDPLSILQAGEEVEVKVCKLDHFLQRINLSLKQMQPDPLLETLESLVSQEAEAGLSCTDASSEAQDAEVNSELNSVLSKLAAYSGISSVVNGRKVRGSALAPAFQIYLSGPQGSGYKLLARFGNEVQEVLVETTLDRDEMKEVIQKCMVLDT